MGSLSSDDAYHVSDGAVHLGYLSDVFWKISYQDYLYHCKHHNHDYHAYEDGVPCQSYGGHD